MTTAQQAPGLQATGEELVRRASEVNLEMNAAVILCGSPGCLGHLNTSVHEGRNMPGDIPDGAIERLAGLAAETGYRVLFDWWTSIEVTLGQTITLTNEQTDGNGEVRDIHVKPGMSPASTLYILGHEITHAQSGDRDSFITSETSDTERREIGKRHIRYEVRSTLASLIMLTVLGIPSREAEISQLAAMAQADFGVFEEVLPEAVRRARELLAALQPDEAAWQEQQLA